jgi:hydrogenase maturation protease
MLAALQRETADGVELVDGGTQGLALLGVIAGRPAMVLLDAVGGGAPPGTVHEMTGEQALALRAGGTGTAHEGGAVTLLRTLLLTGDLPPWVRIVGVEPEVVRTGIGLSPRVTGALPAALQRARDAIVAMRDAVGATGAY